MIKVLMPPQFFDTASFPYLIWNGNPSPVSSGQATTWTANITITDTANTATTVALIDTNSDIRPYPIKHSFYIPGFSTINLDVYYPIASAKTGVEIKLSS